MTSIWSLDLATKIGEAWGTPDRLPSLGHERLPSTGDDIGEFGSAFRRWTMTRLDAVCPTLIVFEAPVLPRPRFNPATKKLEGGVSIQTTRKLQGLAFELETIAYDEGIECCEVQPSEAKLALTGKGNAKKRTMVAAARAVGLDPFTYIVDGEEASDEADASAVFCCTVKNRFPEFAPIWTPLFAGAR